MSPLVVTGFSSALPRHQSSQTDALRWLAGAHAASTGSTAKRVESLLSRYGCGEDKIAYRGHEVDDFLHSDWERMSIYRLGEGPRGAGMEARTRYFDRAVDAVFEGFYPPGAPPPEDLIHVTCTGYFAPSGAQKLVGRRDWGRITRVTHAYHMGCYASIPALRMARGFAERGGRVDIVHTELCSLHFNPELTDPEQLVIESLFADGFIKYSLLAADEGERAPSGLRLLALEERILPGTDGLMQWHCADWGMRMRLSREVPARIEAALTDFLEELCGQAGLDWDALRGGAAFAIHPGGPKILDAVQAALGLSGEQMEASRRVLRERGNMSSATLPHIWAELAADGRIAPGRAVLSLAFGPGLTLCGAVFQKT